MGFPLQTMVGGKKKFPFPVKKKPPMGGMMTPKGAPKPPMQPKAATPAPGADQIGGSPDMDVDDMLNPAGMKGKRSTMLAKIMQARKNKGK